MIKRLMPTIGAFIALIVLLVYANYYETDEILLPGVQKPLSMLDCGENDIRSLTWKSDSESELKIVYNAGGSQIVSPGEYRSDKNEAEGLLKHFAELKSELIIAENATDSRPFGIDASAPVVLIETATRTLALTLGSKTEVGGSYYLARQGDPRIYMVPGYIKGAFNKQLADLRDRQFFNEDFGQVVSFIISTGSDTICLKQAESLSEWKIESPVSLSADGEVVAAFLQNVRNLRVSRFVEDRPEDPAGYGFASPNLKIVINNREGRQFVVEVGEMSGVDTYVRAGDLVAIHAAATADINDLRLAVKDLREKHLQVPVLEDLTEISVSDATGSITLEKKQSGWMIGVQKIADTDVKDFINALGRARINDFVDADQPEKKKDYGIDVIERCRSVELTAGPETIHFWLGNRKGASLIIKTDNEVADISAELDDAFVEFLNRLRRPSEEGKSVVSGDPDLPAHQVEEKNEEGPADQ